MGKPVAPTSLGNIEFDAVISFTETLASDIPDYPVEKGAYVSDSILKKPVEVELVALITNMPVTWRDRHPTSNRVETVKQQLREMYLSGELFTLTRPDKIYKNMGITNLTIPKDSKLNAIEVTMNLKQVTITSVKTVDISYMYGGNTGSSGSLSTIVEQVTQKAGSILSKVFGWVKGIFKK